MVLHVREDDDRSPFVAGMEDVLIDEVLRMRDCILTNKCYPLQSFGTLPGFSRFPSTISKEEAKGHIFHNGPLCCRVVYMRFTGRNGNHTGGVVRHLHSSETDKAYATSPSVSTGLSREHSLVIEDDDEEDAVIVTEGLQTRRKRQARSESIEILESPPKRKSSLPVKKVRYTFGDVFCGAGGASQGAVQAGFHVCWGLDNDEDAMVKVKVENKGKAEQA